MKTNTIFLVSAALLGALGVGALKPDTPLATSPAPAPSVRSQPVQSPVSGYRHWMRVNHKPHKVSSYLAFLCRNATVGEVLADVANTHLGASDHLTLTLPPDYRTRTQPADRKRITWTTSKFVTVYVNKIGERAMMQQSKPTFPQGSLIVKEKLTASDSRSPELLTVMLKRESGYNPDGGDWEYLVLDGSGTRVQAQGKLQNCQSCHAQWKQWDYVSRSYLNAETQHSLR